MATKPAVTDPISTDLKNLMRQLKLGRMLDTLPERLTLAHQQHLSHAAFLSWSSPMRLTAETTAQPPAAPAKQA